jgi:hypothetical protein
MLKVQTLLEMVNKIRLKLQSQGLFRLSGLEIPDMQLPVFQSIFQFEPGRKTRGGQLYIVPIPLSVEQILEIP